MCNVKNTGNHVQLHKVTTELTIEPSSTAQNLIGKYFNRPTCEMDRHFKTNYKFPFNAYAFQPTNYSQFH